MTVGLPRLQRVDIDGINASAFVLNWDFDPQISQSIKSITILLHRNVYNSVPNLETSPRALTVVVRRGISSATEDFVFRGEITIRETMGSQVLIRASDKLYAAVRKNITKTFDSNVDTEAGKISEIFKTLVTTHAGLTADTNSVQDSGTIFIIKVFICNNADIFERLEILADLLDWQFYYNAEDDKVYFEPKGNRSGTNTLTIGTNVVNRPKWIRDGTKVVQIVKVLGGPVESETQETFDGDGSTVDFILTNVPVSVKVTVGGTLQLGGVEDQTPAADFFVNSALNKITFDSGSIPASGTDNIVIDYTYLSPIALRGDNPLVTNGIEVKIVKEELRTVADVENFLTNYLSRHSEDFLSTELQVVNITNLEVGQTVTVVDTNESIDQTFIVTKIVKSFPYRYDVVKVDTEPLQIEQWEITIDDRLRRIEEKLSQDETLVIIIKSFTRPNKIKIGKRYSQLEKQDIRDTGTVPSFILGNTIAGRLGTDLLGDRTQSNVLTFLQQGGDFYLEDFDDVDFKGPDTTANWNTGVPELSFTASQKATSNSIDFNNSTITAAKLTAVSSSGSFDYEMSLTSLNPVTHFKMNDDTADTNVVDSFGSNDGTLNGGDNTEDKTATGKINEAFLLNGTDDFININSVLTALASDTKGTLAIWVKPVDATPLTVERMLSFGDTDANEFMDIRNRGASAKIRIKVRNAAGNLWTLDSDNAVFSDNTWVHIALVQDGVSPVLYIDGVAVAQTFSTSTDKTAWFSVLTGLDNGRIGNVSNNGGGEIRHFNGTIDDARFYDVALTADDISSIYAAGNGIEDEIPIWESVTSGTSHTFTNSGTDLRWRATENLSSTGVITSVTLEDYH